MAAHGNGPETAMPGMSIVLVAEVGCAMAGTASASRTGFGTASHGNEDQPGHRPEQSEKGGTRRGVPPFNGFRAQAGAGLCLASAMRLRAQRRDLPNMPPSLRSDSGAPCRTLLR